MASDLTDIIQDDGVRLFRPALEAVQFGGHDWKKTARSALEWGYAGLQYSSFHLSPKELAEGTLAEEVKTFHKELRNAYDGEPFGIAGFSTHCALLTWGYPQKPGIIKLIPASNEMKAKLYGKPNEIRSWMWDNVVQYVPQATAKLDLMGTHTFIPPAVIGDIPELEFAGADIADYNFVFNHDVPVLRDGSFANLNLWQEAVLQQGKRLEPFFKLCEDNKIYTAHEVHWDTIGRSPEEFLAAREMLGERAKSVMYIGLDVSHAWESFARESRDRKLDWINKLGPLTRWLHIKNNLVIPLQPLITGESAWSNRGMHFAAEDEGDLSIGEQLNYVAMRSELIYHPTYHDEKPAGKIGSRPVYTKWAIAEGEHPIVTQVSVAKGYARALQPLCDRRYGEGFKVGGAKG